jgi:hypothetical protein
MYYATPIKSTHFTCPQIRKVALYLSVSHWSLKRSDIGWADDTLGWELSSLNIVDDVSGCAIRWNR